MNIVVNEALKAYIDPLTPEEYEALERSILAEGCRDALVLWGDLLVDGHNRYGICQKHGLPFQTVQSKLFHSMEDVHLWMIDQHLGRRSVACWRCASVKSWPNGGRAGWRPPAKPVRLQPPPRVTSKAHRGTPPPSRPHHPHSRCQPHSKAAKTLPGPLACAAVRW